MDRIRAEDLKSLLKKGHISYLFPTLNDSLRMLVIMRYYVIIMRYYLVIMRLHADFYFFYSRECDELP